MAGNDRGKAMMPLLGDRGESAQQKCADPWDEVKLDAIRLYQDEGKDLEAIRREIGKIYGFTRWYVRFYSYFILKTHIYQQTITHIYKF
jgi:hypothetical protein